LDLGSGSGSGLGLELHRLIRVMAKDQPPPRLGYLIFRRGAGEGEDGVVVLGLGRYGGMDSRGEDR